MTTPSWSSWLPDWSAINDKSLTLLVGWETSSKKVQVRSLPISQTVADDLRKPVADTAAKLAARTAVAYSPDLELDGGQYAVVERAQLDTTSSMVDSVETVTPAEADKDDLKRPLLFYALAVGPANGRLVFIRQANPRAQLTKKYFGVLGDELSRVTDPLFSFDLDRVDVVLVVGHGLAVPNLKAFERLFRDSPELIARTPEKVKELAAVVSMTPDARKALEVVAARNGRVRTRLLAVLNSGLLSSVTTATLEASMKQFGLDPAVHLKGGVLDFDETTVMSIMQLLNEDLSIGSLSGTTYQITKKSPK